MATSKVDGYFSTEERGDGFYVKINAPGPGGKEVSFEDIIGYCQKNSIETVDINAVHGALSSEKDNIFHKIADKYSDNQYDKDKQFKLEVSEDRMSAYITFYPVNGEEQYQVNLDVLERELKGRNVIFGIDSELLLAISKDRVFNEAYLVAEGKTATDPIPGKVNYHFKTTKDFTPEVDEEGNVNFRKLSVISNVKEGELLASLVQTKPGVAGKNLSGIEIASKKGKPVRISYGKNTKPNENKTELFADVSGLVRLFDGKIVVNNIYEVPNHVGNSTGNIDFDGSVIIHGNVITGFTVKAKGDVEVMGVVEGATLIAGGDIVLHSGIQGMGKSDIEAGGDLQTKFIEQAKVICRGDIYSEAILHSEVSCKGVIHVEGKKGMISGGAVRAGGGVNSRILGSHMGTATEIEVGIDPLVLAEYAELRKHLPKMIDEADKLEKVIILLNKRKEIDGKLEQNKADMYKSAVRNKVFLANKVAVSQKRIDQLQEEVDSRNKGVVKVQGAIYPGVKVGIGNIYKFVKEEIKYVKFYKEGADIKMTSL